MPKLITPNGSRTFEPVFGVIKSAMGFRRFHIRSITLAATEWFLMTLGYNCRRLTSWPGPPLMPKPAILQPGNRDTITEQTQSDTLLDRI